MFTPTGALAAFLQTPEEMINLEFYDLTDILVDMWHDARIPLRKHLIDYIIIFSLQ